MVDTGLQPLAIGISIAAPCIAFLFVLLRLYSRYFITRNVAWDDALIILPMILSIAQAYTTVLGIKVNYVGYHTKDIPWSEYDAVLGAKVEYIALYTLVNFPSTNRYFLVQLCDPIAV